MFYCELCGDTDCCERTDLIGEPVLCDRCCSLINLYCDYLLIKTIVRIGKILKDN